MNLTICLSAAFLILSHAAFCMYFFATERISKFKTDLGNRITIELQNKAIYVRHGVPPNVRLG